MDPVDGLVTTYGLEHGLPTLNLSAMAPGPDGHLWVATPNGLFAFDGRRFRLVDPGTAAAVGQTDGDEGRGTESPLLQDTLQLLVDRRGVIWGSERSGRVWRMENGVFEVVSTGGAVAWAGLLMEASDGAILAGGLGLVRIDGSSVEVLLDVREDPQARVTSVLELAAGTDGGQEFEVGTQDGLLHWSRAKGLQRIDTVPTIALFRDGAGRRWRVGANGTTVSGCEIVIPRQVNSGRLTSSVVIDSDRTLLTLDSEAYIADFSLGQPRLEPYGDPYTIAQVLPGPGDSLWVTTRNRGLELIRPRYFQRIEVPASGRTIYVVKPGGPNEVLLGSWLIPSVWRWRADDPSGALGVEVAATWNVPESPKTPFPGVFDVISSDGKAGFVQTNQGLMRFASDAVDPLDSEGAHGGQMAQVKSGAIWARARAEIVEYVDEKKTGRTFSLDSRPLTELIADGDDLIGFPVGRVVEFDTGSMTKRVILEPGEGVLGSLYLHPSGDLWVLSDGAGLFRRDADGTWDQWTTEHGLPTNSLGWGSVVPGPTETTHLWINSNVGLLAVSFESLEGVAEGRQDFLDCVTLGTPESLAGDGVACANGTLVVPTFEGPIAVDTHQNLPRVEPPVLSMGSIVVGGQLYDEGRSVYGPTDAVFQYRAAQFPFQFSSKVQLRLDGHDDEWVEGNDDRRVRYTSLAPGRYQMQLRASAPGLGFGPVLMGPVLTILPHWHDRLWVRMTALAALTLLGVGVYRLRTRILVHRGKVLEQLLGRARVSESRYRQLFRTTPTSIVMWHTAGFPLERNDAAYRQFPFTAEDGITLLDMASGDNARQLLEGTFRKVLAGEDVDAIQLATRVATETSHICTWYLVPLMREERKVHGIMTLILDNEDEVQSAKAVRQLRRQLARAEEAERSRLARELHDDFSQRLAAVSLSLRMTENRIGEQIDSTERETLEASIRGIEELAEDVHALSRQLHPAVLDDLGLDAALRSECARRASLTQTTIQFEDDGLPRRLPNEASLALFRVAQEAMQNAVKHSGAARILVRVGEGPDGLELVVQDDGSGFEASAPSRSGIGLSSMRERMSLVEGSFELESKAGSGTRIKAVAPVAPLEAQP